MEFAIRSGHMFLHWPWTIPQGPFELFPLQAFILSSSCCILRCFSVFYGPSVSNKYFPTWTFIALSITLWWLWRCQTVPVVSAFLLHLCGVFEDSSCQLWWYSSVGYRCTVISEELRTTVRISEDKSVWRDPTWREVSCCSSQIWWARRFKFDIMSWCLYYGCCVWAL